MAGRRPSAAPSRTAIAVGAAVLATAAGSLCAPATAVAHTRTLVTPRAVQVVRVNSSSFTVTAHAAGQKFRLWAAFRPRHLGTVRIHRAAVKSHFSRSPRLTLRNLRYTTRPYYYRVEAIDGSRHRFSPILGTVGLQPAAPTTLTATSSPTGGTFLTWHSERATGFVITQATDPSMTQGVVTYRTQNQIQQFTPYRVQPGTTYYFRVQAVNDRTLSAPSNVASVMPLNDQQPVRVMTYNILEATNDGRAEGGNHVAPWTERRDAQVALIRQASPDVIAIQEGASFVGSVSAQNTRQVDDLVNALGGEYSLAVTEIPPTQRHWHRYGDYILYKTGEYVPVGQGGVFPLGDNHFAAYQVLRNAASGAKFLFVGPHLIVPRGRANDLARLAETQQVVSQASAYAASYGVPVVYAGDFNSDPAGHSPDGPTVAMLASHIDDAYDVAQHRTNARYNSANQYYTKPMASHLRIDYIWAPPGVAVSSWQMLLHLSHGRFVGVIPSDHNPVVADLLVPYLAVS